MKKPSYLFTVIISAITFGALTGALASIIATTYLDEELSSITGSRPELNLADSIYDRANLIIQDAKNVVVNQDVKVEETAATVRPSLVSIFKETEGESLEAPFYHLADALGFGFIISADGWVLVNGELPMVSEADLENYFVLGSDRSKYSLEKVLPVVLPGEQEISLIKLKGAQNLPVRSLAAATDLKPGTSIILLTASGEILPNTVIAKTYPAGVISSDHPEAQLVLAQAPDATFNQSLAFTLSGGFVGWWGEDKVLHPAYLFNSAWQSLISKGKLSWPFLGVNYWDLSRTVATDSKLDRGAWLVDSDKPAVLSGSPAAAAGLKAGDVILKVNNQELNRDFTLTAALVGHLPGDRLVLSYDRAGSLNEVEVTLTELLATSNRQ
ncbi:MAG: S1C family serine protease [Candidatus Parcubacteria bacterium]|jgi:serine protease Do|nr:MAG: hypothetical protein JST_4710 [Candidatus Parcubacteria bacterium]